MSDYSTGLYRIAPPAWQEVKPGWFRWETVFGGISVQDDGDGAWQWRYCFDEYYDEGCEPCESAEAGKRAAEEFYLARLLPALTPAGETP